VQKYHKWCQFIGREDRSLGYHRAWPSLPYATVLTLSCAKFLARWRNDRPKKKKKNQQYSTPLFQIKSRLCFHDSRAAGLEPWHVRSKTRYFMVHHSSKLARRPNITRVLALHFCWNASWRLSPRTDVHELRLTCSAGRLCLPLLVANHALPLGNEIDRP
jgi:hypothetical protein